MKWIFRVSLFLGIVASFAPLMAHYFWGLALFEHFRLQMACLSLALCLISLLCRQSRLLVLGFMALILWNASFLKPAFVSDIQPLGAQTESDQVLKVMSVNMLARNQNQEAFLAQVEAVQPDVLIVIEFTPFWQTALQNLTAYKYSQELPRRNSTGLAIYSKRPFDGDIHFFSDGQPYMHARFDDNNLRLFAIHTKPPISKNMTARRNREMLELATQIQAQNKERILVMGDFNDTRWSRNMRQFLELSSLKSLFDGQKFQWTWPQFFWPMGVQIDHAFGSNIHAANAETMAVSGSDHRAIIVEIMK